MNLDKAPACTLIDAFACIDARIAPKTAAEAVPVSCAVGRILTADLAAPLPSPPFDSAAMDGFALRDSDLGTDGLALLRHAQIIRAGTADVLPLEPGTCARILTGGKIPPGADRVIRQEQCELRGDHVLLRSEPGDRRHIRLAGEELAQGALAIAGGTRLQAGHVALLTGLGLSHVGVQPTLRVGLLSTGDELARPGMSLGAGQIYDSNRPMIAQFLTREGVEVTDLGSAPDDPAAIEACLAAAAPDHDLLLTSGGASVGFADHLARIVSDNGSLTFRRVDMRPGKPVAFGEIAGCPILLLPGNPLAALAGFVLFGRRILRRLRGETPGHDSLWLPLSQGFEKPARRALVLSARLQRRAEDGMTHVVPWPNQGSASLPVIAEADVLALLPPGPEAIAAGSVVEVLPLR